MKKKRLKYQQVVANDGGWSDWIWPTHTGYRLGCCDCGLVHNVDFRVDTDLLDGEIIIGFRVSRNRKSTAGKRKGKRFSWLKGFEKHIQGDDVL